MDTKVINNIRSLAIDMINEAGSGHPGVCLDAAPCFYSLFANHMRFNKDDPFWINRDRFVLSAGHASALLYSTLFFCGYPIDIGELKRFRKSGGIPGHPEYNLKYGVEMTSGALGEGFATAVGMAIAEEYLRNTISKDLIYYNTYVFVSDGDLMEGISYEAASLAGSLHLGKLIVLYDSNDVSNDGKTLGVFDENVLKRFETMGWHTESVNNSEDYNAIDKAIEKCKLAIDKPSIIEIKSIIGIGTSLSGSAQAHSGVLKAEDISLVKEKMQICNVPFHISKDAIEFFREKINTRLSSTYNDWVNVYNKLIVSNDVKRNLISKLESNNYDIDNLVMTFDEGVKEDIRVTNQKLMDSISEQIPFFIGGSADVARSTKAYISDSNNKSNTICKNIRFGVRENAMGAIVNGLALSNLRSFGSTFLTFSDFMKPSIRFSAMMNLPVTYIFTHDSIKIGEDGKTHQPIEQLASLRNIPGFNVFRPADATELLGCWKYIIKNKIPSAIVLSKEKVERIKGSSEDIHEGAYIIRMEKGRLSGILVSNGSDLETALMISDELEEIGIYTRVISMPNYKLFSKASNEYRLELFPVGVKIVIIEASSDYCYNDLVYSNKYILNINDFGISGSKNEVLEYFKFNYDNLKERVINLLR